MRLFRGSGAIGGPNRAGNRNAATVEPSGVVRRGACSPSTSPSPVTSVTGVRAPARGSMNFRQVHALPKMIRFSSSALRRKNRKKPQVFSWPFFPDLRELGENCYLVLDILARIKYNTRCVPKTAGGVSRKSCRGRQTCFAIRPCVFAHRDGSFFERTDDFPGGEH